MTSNHDAGATWPYQGHKVSLLWQFLHERSRIALTGGGTVSVCSSVCDGVTGGLLRPAGTNWMTTNAMRAIRSSRRNRRNIRGPHEANGLEPAGAGRPVAYRFTR